MEKKLENKKTLPNDKDIRFEFIKRNLGFFKKEDTIFVNEYGINRRNVIDLASFDFKNNVLVGFEIKSHQDNLKRIEKQLMTYTEFFNVVYVVCADSHVKKLIEFLDSKDYGRKVGIIEVDKELNFKEIKKAIYNKSFFDTFIKNLDKEEIMMLCEEHDLPSNDTKYRLIGRLKRFIDYKELYKSLKNKLRKYYVKKCPSCKSNLYYNKFVKGDKNSYCYECGSLIPD